MLVQDLINNDMKIKGANSRKNNGKFSDSLDRYLKTGEYDDDYEDEVEEVHVKDKYKKNYDYLYDMKRFYVLLHRGLEYLDEEALNYYLTSNSIVELDKPLDNEIVKSLNLNYKKIAM